MAGLTITPLELGRIQPGDDLGALLADAVQLLGVALQRNDVIVVAQKIVSKAEGRYVRLDDVVPSEEARLLAERLGRPASMMALVLREAASIVRATRQVLIVRHKRGYVMANAGIDQSNLDPRATDGEAALLLPEDPDASASRLRETLARVFGVDCGVVVSDSFGRAWRMGTTGVAIGAAGLPTILDRRGQTDLFGRKLQATVIGFADNLAAAAALVMGEAAEGRPAVLVRGLEWEEPDGTAADLIRPVAEDLFL